ncbi:MAG: hypothetical protein BGO12_00135 [Verrucomicrobia bacterium 61-8]|nr:substrate-binding domain-containing protein [Verrucomicrobiota bacterium]OJV24071.1 MAG: hypothetical protein BGO12_00135 [Verrucomicrobia bacterium 61-8]
MNCPLSPHRLRSVAIFTASILLCLQVSCHRNPHPADDTVRVAIIGGFATTGMWDEVTAEFTRQTGIPVEVVSTGPKEIIDKAFRQGGIDLITLHSSDVATNLVADGLGVSMKPWARNELVIVGPPEDPAKIRGLKSGAEAMARIAAARAPFVEARNVGSQTISAHLWKLAGIRPEGDWLIRDESPVSQRVVEFAAERRAYVIVGRIPMLSGKIPNAGMEILVEGDPEMRRPYVVIKANPARQLGRNPAGARKLAEFLTSPAGQRALSRFAERQGGNAPIFYPVEPLPTSDLKG